MTTTPSTPDSLRPPRWLHAWAIVTVVAALLPMFLGSEVTTKGVGMVDPDGFSHFREPWIFLRQWQEGSLVERGLAYMIEHGHRLAGIVIGLCAIVLAASLWLRGGRQILRWLGLAALLAVCVQGLVGALRVHLNALIGPNLALIHGLSAALVLALLVSAAVLTSPGWLRPVARFDASESRRLRRLALSVLGLVYLQLILGAFVRHANTPLASRLHVLTAFLVIAGIAWLLREWLSTGRTYRGEWAAAAALAALVGLQVFLGLEALLSKFRVAEILTTEPLSPLFHPHLVRSLHYLTGAGVFSATLVVTLLVFRRSRQPAAAASPPSTVVHEMEGAL